MQISKQLVQFFIVLVAGICLILLVFKTIPEKLPSFILNPDNAASLAITAVIALIGLYNCINSYGIVVFTKLLLAWYGIFLLFIIGYAFRFELKYVSQRTLAVIIPSYSWSNDNGEIAIARSNDGQFYINVMVNDVPIKFMIDTGASDVALSKQDAVKLNFDLSKLSYTKIYSTANGSNAAAPVILQKLQVDSKVLENVEAAIGQGELDTSLFGMSVISRFKNFKISQDILTLSY